LTKHGNQISTISKFQPKLTRDWCYTCGKRINRFIEISYPENAENELNLLEQQRNSRLESTNIETALDLHNKQKQQKKRL